MILTVRARWLVQWCDGEQSKIRMQDSGGQISSNKIGNGGNKGQKQRADQGRQKAAKS
jgi:hypothetical protein